MSKGKDKADVWMPLFIGDYLADTTRLTTEQHGAYLLLLMDYWRNGPPPHDDATLAQITRLTAAAWKKAKPAVIRFFKEEGGLLHQKRADQELLSSRGNKAKATAQSLARWGDASSEARGRHLRSQRLAEARAKGTHTAAEWEAMKAYHGNCCVRCGAHGEMVKDHIQPIYQGGSDAIDNLQPLCRKCNASKGPEAIDHRKDGWRDAIKNAFDGGILLPPNACPSTSPSPAISKVSGDVNLSGTASAAAHATAHLLNATTGEENPRHVQLAILLRKTYGMAVTSNHADVTEMVRLAVSDQEIAEAVEVFGMKKPGDKPNAGYVLGIIRSAREQAAKAAAAASGKPAQAGAPAQVSVEWWTSAEGIKAKGRELGTVWKESEGELFIKFKARVFKLAGEGPWRQQMLRETERDEAMHARLMAFFYPTEEEA